MNQLNILHDVDLSSCTTFGFRQRAAYFVEVSSEAELTDAVQLAQRKNWPILALGGGSNLVLSKDYPGLVIKQIDQQIDYQLPNLELNPSSQQPTDILVTASAGVLWHDLVTDTIDRNLPGLENLSLIPGHVGAAPVQNIGAYGVELCERFVSLRALHLPTGKWRTMCKQDCEFSYRDSHFKQHEGQYIISKVTLKLGEHLGLQTGYTALADYLQLHYPDQTIDAKILSQAVCTIRKSKLPDPKEIPNAGSFFHNPVVSTEHFIALKRQFPGIAGYPVSDQQYKLAAGWLIDHLGYKGYRKDGVGVHDKQALVLIKYRQTDACKLLELAERICRDVQTTFGVSLSIEPRIL